MKQLLRQIKFLFTGAIVLDRRINETLNHHCELQDRVAKVECELRDRVAKVECELRDRVEKFESDIEDLKGIFDDFSCRVVVHLNEIESESDRINRMTEKEFEAFRKLLLELADEILQLPKSAHDQ